MASAALWGSFSAAQSSGLANLDGSLAARGSWLAPLGWGSAPGEKTAEQKPVGVVDVGLGENMLAVK